MNVKDLTRHVLSEEPRRQFDAWSKMEATLQTKFNEAQNQVHKSLCGMYKCENVFYISKLQKFTNNIKII